MRPSDKSIILSPFTDSHESEQVEEQLFLLSEATGCAVTYLCLHPSKEDRTLDFSYGLDRDHKPLRKLARTLCEQERRNWEVPDVPGQSELDDSGLRELDPNLRFLASYPLHFENQFLGLLVLLDPKKKKLSERQKKAFHTVAHCLLRIFQQRKLRKQSEIFQERVNIAEELGGLGYWELELKDNTLLWSQGVYKMCGVDPRSFEVSVEAFYELVHPDDRPAILEQQEAITLRERETMDIEHRMVLPNGDTIWVHERGYLFRDATGKPRIFKGTVQDITEIKERQQAEEQYTAFMESSLANLPIGLCMYKLSDRSTLYSNDKLYDIIEWPRSANPDGPTLMKKLYPNPEQRIQRREEMEEALKNPGSRAKEWKAQQITTGSGKKKLVNTRFVILRDHNILLLILSDVTEIHKTKEKLTFMNERYRLASLATSDVIWDSDLILKEHFWGDNYTKIFGYENIQDLAYNFKDWENHVHPEDLQRVLDSLENTLRSRKRTWISEYRYRHGKTGEYRRVMDQGYILRSKSGKAYRMVGAMKDITEKYNKEEELRLFESAIENTSDGILITKTAPMAPPEEHEILFSNRALQKMTGFSKNELLGKPPTIFRGENTDENAMRKLNEDTSKLASRTIDVVNYKKNGDAFWINLSVTPIVNEANEAVHFLSIQREITSKKAEETNRNLINRLAKDFSKAISSKQLAGRLVKSVGETLDAQVVEMWLLDEFDTRMDLAGAYHSKPAYRKFSSGYKRNSLGKKYHGFLGKVYKKKQAIAHRDISNTGSPIKRRELAGDLELNAVYGLPLFSGTEVIGILLIFHKDGPRDYSKLMKKRMQDCDLFIGSEFKRKYLNEQLAEILSSVPDMICLIGNDGYFKKVNPATSSLLGYEEEELFAKPILHFLHPDDRFASLRQMIRIVEGAATPYFENRMCKKDGGYLWVAWTASKSNTQQQFLAVGKNISTTKQQVAAIQASNERFRLLSEATNDAVWEWNAKEDQLIWTEGFEQLFGYAPGSAYNFEDWMEKVHPEDLDRVMKHSEEVFKDKSANTVLIDYRFRRSDDSYAYVTDHSRLIRDKSGQVVTVIGAMQDISERKRFERDLMELNQELKTRNEQLESSNTELEHFAYVASHDLQEPLRMISGFLTQLEKKYNNQLDEKGRTYIHYAVDGSKRMRTIIRELLEYSRVGRVQDHKEAVSVSEVLDEVEVVYRILLQQCNGKIIRPEKLPVIYGHKVLVFQLFQNLVDNALKYRKKDVAPEIRFSSRDTGTHYEFTIEDNGIGIDPSYFSKIFVIFQRLHQKDEYGGAGMGLTTAKKIVESMGGKITVASEKGKGTRFIFTLKKHRKQKGTAKKE